MERIAAGIILFNPELTRLKENIEAIFNQVELIIMIDNNSANIDIVERECSIYNKIILIKNDENRGIAAALNQAMNYCKTNGYKWVITLDQDSICPLNMVEEYQKYLNIPNVAIVSPTIEDRNKEPIELNKSKIEYEFINKCITSGALTNVEAWGGIGGFDELMFIDLVDFDYCIRLKKTGYEIIKLNNIKLIHEIGNIVQRRIFKWKINIGNHSDIRKYHMSKNILYFSRKHKRFGSIFVGYLRIIKLFILTIVYEKNKVKKGKAILKGVRNYRELTIYLK